MNYKLSNSDHSGFIQFPFLNVQMIFLHYTPQTLAWRISSYLCRSPDQEKEDEDHISYFLKRLWSAKELFLIFKGLCQRIGSKRMMQTNAAVARFQILLVSKRSKKSANRTWQLNWLRSERLTKKRKTRSRFWWVELIY